MINQKVEEIRKHFESIMEILEIEKTDSNELTPLRIAKMYCNELFEHRNNLGIDVLDSQMKLFDIGDPCDYPVTMEGIEFNSVCEHHFLPFFGDCRVTYTPKDKVIGLSKIPRVVRFFSRKPQLQERLTQEIGEYLFNILNPYNITVEMEALHTCVMCRGIESKCKTKTIFTKGDF